MPFNCFNCCQFEIYSDYINKFIVIHTPINVPLLIRTMTYNTRQQRKGCRCVFLPSGGDRAPKGKLSKQCKIRSLLLFFVLTLDIHSLFYLLFDRVSFSLPSKLFFLFFNSGLSSSRYQGPVSGRRFNKLWVSKLAEFLVSEQLIGLSSVNSELSLYTTTIKSVSYAYNYGSVRPNDDHQHDLHLEWRHLDSLFEILCKQPWLTKGLSIWMNMLSIFPGTPQPVLLYEQVITWLTSNGPCCALFQHNLFESCPL